MQKADINEKKRENLKLHNVNQFHYIIKPKSLITLLFLALLPWLMSCGGKQRPASSSVAASPAENDTSGVASGNTNEEGVPDSSATPAGGTPSISGTTPPVSSSPTTSTAVVGTTSTTVTSQSKTRFEEVKPIFQKRCTLCHGPGKMQPTSDWLDYATSKSRVDNGELFNRIWTLKDDPAKGMPMGNSTQMTDEERELIKKWIEDGGLE
ncbi:MAG: c-type cytochrome [Bdellovibrionales bacterium]|nr:c-type cytochrome [Bdellovibrionales bacterium]